VFKPATLFLFKQRLFRERLRKTASEIEVRMRVNDEIIVSEVIDGMELSTMP